MSAELHVLPSAVEAEGKALAADLRENVETMIADQPRLAGFAVVVWGADQVTSTAFKNGPHSTIPATLLPAFCGDLIRSRMIVERAVERICIKE